MLPMLGACRSQDTACLGVLPFHSHPFAARLCPPCVPLKGLHPTPWAPGGVWPFSGLCLPPPLGDSIGKHIPHCVTSLHGLPRG